MIMANQQYFLGVDVHLNSYTVACIDNNYSIKMLIDEMTEDDLMQYIQTNHIQYIAVDAPHGPNLGYMDDLGYRASLNTALRGHYNKKVAEYELSRRGISLYNTPQDKEEMNGWLLWMKTGIKLFKRLEQLGYQHLNEVNGRHPIKQKCTAEVFPHGSFVSLAKYIPINKTTSEGIAQREQILRDQGFKNLYKHLTGAKRSQADRLDAIVAAYTIMRIYGGNGTFVGDRREGQIAIPVAKLENKYTYLTDKFVSFSVEQNDMIAQFARSNIYEYTNYDNVVWLKHFTAMEGAPRINRFVDFKKQPNLKVYAQIRSIETQKFVEVVFQAINNSIHGMKVLPEYKEVLCGFWSHGDRKKYTFELALLD
jgi:hypothetical protein